MKKGIVEVADAIVVNKCDRDSDSPSAAATGAGGFAAAFLGSANGNTLSLAQMAGLKEREARRAKLRAAAAGGGAVADDASAADDADSNSSSTGAARAAAAAPKPRPGAVSGPAAHAAAEYRRALGLLRPKHSSTGLPPERQRQMWAFLAAQAAAEEAEAGTSAAAAAGGAGADGHGHDSLPMDAAHAHLHVDLHSMSPRVTASATLSALRAGMGVALWLPPVLRVSAHEPTAGDTIPGLWETAAAFWRTLGGTGVLAHRRQSQAMAWMAGELESQLLALARRSPAVRDATASLRDALEAGHATPRRAARVLLSAFLTECVGAANAAAANAAAAPRR